MMKLEHMMENPNVGIGTIVDVKDSYLIVKTEDNKEIKHLCSKEEALDWKESLENEEDPMWLFYWKDSLTICKDGDGK